MTFKLKPYFNNFSLICKHKWFVLIAGLKLNVPIYNLIIHDFSKLSPAEFPHYAKQFFGGGAKPEDFARAWNHHQKKNPHHWEYWVMESGHNRGGMPDGTILKMPQSFAREMVADWFAAHRAYEGYWPENFENWKWMNENFEKIKLHRGTRFFVKNLLDEHFKTTMIDEIELQNQIDDLKRENTSLEYEIDDLTKDLQKFEAKELRDEFVVNYIKDRQEHAEAMGDKHAVEIYKEILKKA